MRKLSYMLALPLLALAACSQESDAPIAPDAGNGETGKTVLSITRTAANDLTSAGIDEVNILIYEKVKVMLEDSTFVKTTVLVKDLTLTPDQLATDGYEFTELLGKDYQTVVFANALPFEGDDMLEAKKTIATLYLKLNPEQTKPVFCSDVKGFKTDKSVSNLALTLNRVVSRLDFAPAKEDDLSTITEFDNLKLTFKKMADKYYPINANSALAKSGELVDFVISVTAAENYTKSIYTFTTEKTKEVPSLAVEYLKGSNLVYVSKGDLEWTKAWVANTVYNVRLPLTAAVGGDGYREVPGANGVASRPAAPIKLNVTTSNF